MRIFGIAVLALFFSLGFSQVSNLGNPQTQSEMPPPLAPADSASALEPISEPVQEPVPAARASGNIPLLAPKGEFEKQKDFDARKAKWEKDAINKLTAKDTTAKGYANRIEYAKELGFDTLTLKALTIVLEDRIVAEDSKLITQKAPNAKIELSSYNAETETFDLHIQDTANTSNPFIFQGSVTIPMSMAKSIDRNNPDFSTSVVFLNSTYEPDETTKLHLAMQKLLLHKGSKNLNVKGSFAEVELGNMSNYYAYKQRTDSILKGTLKSHDLSYKDALKIANGGQPSSRGESLMGWRGWTRLAAFTLAAASGVGAAFKHSDAGKYKEDINELENRARVKGIYDDGPGVNDPYRNEWRIQYSDRKTELLKNERYRNIFGISAGVFAVAGVATFFF